MSDDQELEKCNQRLVQINDALSDLVEAVGNRAAKESQAKHVYGDPHYTYIPFDHSMFLDALLGVKHWLKGEGFFGNHWTPHKGNGVPSPRFIDVGCGIGDKVLLARNIGFDGYGVEYDDFLVRCARWLFFSLDDKADDPRIKHRCALEHNYVGYHVIYFYQPFQGEEQQKKLEQKIYRQADLGAFIITPQYLTPPSRRQYVTCSSYGNESMSTEDTVSIFRRVRKGSERIVFRP